jgi:hypothetical protein
MDDRSIWLTWTIGDTDSHGLETDIYNLTNMNPMNKVVSSHNVSEFYLRED